MGWVYPISGIGHYRVSCLIMTPFPPCSYPLQGNMCPHRDMMSIPGAMCKVTAHMHLKVSPHRVLGCMYAVDPISQGLPNMGALQRWCKKGHEHYHVAHTTKICTNCTQSWPTVDQILVDTFSNLFSHWYASQKKIIRNEADFSVWEFQIRVHMLSRCTMFGMPP
jgi:hypothetical protein